MPEPGLKQFLNSKANDNHKLKLNKQGGIMQKGNVINYFVFIIRIWIRYTQKTVRLIKMCLNEACSKVVQVCIMSDAFPIQNGLKQDAF
jgi:hypothetical protein